MTSPYTRLIERLAPDHDPAHVEAWMRLEHGTLDALNAVHFAREVHVAIACIERAGVEESDELARSYGLEPRGRTPVPADYRCEDRILVQRDPGLEPAEATIVAESDDRPHLVKVIYEHSRTGAWIARRRIVGYAHR